MSVITQALGVIVKPISDAFSARQERKKAETEIKVKAGMARQEGADKVTLTDAEWEVASKQAENGTWKDEWVTILFTLPVLSIFVGGVWLAFTGDERLLVGTENGINALNSNVEGLYGELLTAVTLAAIGLKLWRRG